MPTSIYFGLWHSVVGFYMKRVVLIWEVVISLFQKILIFVRKIANIQQEDFFSFVNCSVLFVSR